MEPVHVDKHYLIFGARAHHTRISHSKKQRHKQGCGGGANYSCVVVKLVRVLDGAAISTRQTRAAELGYLSRVPHRIRLLGAVNESCWPPHALHQRSDPGPPPASPQRHLCTDVHTAYRSN